MHLVNATERGVWVEPLVSYLDQKNGYTEVDLLHSSYFLHQKTFTILSSKRTQIVKRILDILFSLFLIMLAFPIGVLTAILIKLESKGPIFYKQLRTGQFNSEFKVIKFRSMRQDAEKGGAKCAEITTTEGLRYTFAKAIVGQAKSPFWIEAVKKCVEKDASDGLNVWVQEKKSNTSGRPMLSLTMYEPNGLTTE